MTPLSLADKYLKSLEQIMKPPPGASPILACSKNEKKQVLELIKRDNIEAFKEVQFKIDSKGIISDQNNDGTYEIYKGNFSNEGIVEYAIVSTGGTGGYNTVKIFKLVKDHLLDANLDEVISHDLLHGGDVGPGFYGHTASPFAIIKGGKTYIRYMDLPASRNYDKTQLTLCTYLWEKNKISLSGPNYTFLPGNEKLSEAKNCIH
jgi:hypothetical protein